MPAPASAWRLEQHCRRPAVKPQSCLHSRQQAAASRRESLPVWRLLGRSPAGCLGCICPCRHGRIDAAGARHGWFYCLHFTCVTPPWSPVQPSAVRRRSSGDRRHAPSARQWPSATPGPVAETLARPQALRQGLRWQAEKHEWILAVPVPRTQMIQTCSPAVPGCLQPCTRG